MNNSLNENQDNPLHKPVMLTEVINYLDVKKDKIYVDCTLGLGGHSYEILKKLQNTGMLIGIERDEESLKIAKERLKEFKNCHLIHSNFIDLPNILNRLKIGKITGGILLDFGINSHQLDSPNRGFSIKSSGPLDMRMDTTQALSALKVINSYKEADIADIIYYFGEERYSRKIARMIVEARQKLGPFKSTEELKDIILRSYPRNKHFKTHPATKTFQAIRIEVNKELENIEEFLCFIPELLLSGTRLTFISFHSLEDRKIKNFLKQNRELTILTKKPVIPSVSETELNPRSRSAKFRAAEKL